ncbi:MAG: phosphatidylglycerophosphatase A family protein, partial [Bdellovibrionota bacterium]
FIATFFYVGKSPIAPGTMGSLAALPFAWYLWLLPISVAWPIVITVFIVGCLVSSVVIRRTGKEDHQSIVIDEVIGIFLTTSIAAHLWWHYLLAFLLFRIFDIWKPFPVGLVDKNVKGGIGTMLDDVVAAVFATGILWVVLRYSAGMVGAAA